MHAAPAGLALALCSCVAAPLISPLKTAASGSLRAEDNRSAAGLQQKLLDEWRKDAALRQLRPSVSIANDISTLFSNRYSIVVGGYAPTPEDRDRALAGIPDILAIDRRAAIIRDLVKIEPRDGEARAPL